MNLTATNTLSQCEKQSITNAMNTAFTINGERYRILSIFSLEGYRGRYAVLCPVLFPRSFEPSLTEYRRIHVSLKNVLLTEIYSKLELETVKRKYQNTVKASRVIK